jgi:hypothetical protein
MKKALSDYTNQFTEVIQLIIQARTKAVKAANTELIMLYWSIGAYISKRVESEGWGQSVVVQLAKYIQHNNPELKGFSDKNLWRMMQFFETYKDDIKLNTVERN